VSKPMTLIEAQEQVEAMKAELASALASAEAVKTEAAEAQKKAEAALAAVTAERDGLKAEVVKITADHASVISVFEAEKTAHAGTKTKLESAERKLADPAFLRAAAGGAAPVAEGGQIRVVAFATKADAMKAYEKITSEDPIEAARMKAAFRAENKQILGL